MKQTKISAIAIDKELEVYTLYLTIRDWQRFKKMVDEEFDNDYGSYKEVRINLNSDDTVDVEGHCILNRKRANTKEQRLKRFINKLNKVKK